MNVVAFLIGALVGAFGVIMIAVLAADEERKHRNE